MNIPLLNELQRAAINEVGLLAGEHVLVSAPTSSGKTLLGELVAAQAAGRGQRTVFLLSTKALVNDKHAAFTETYASLGLRVRRATGEIDDEALMILRVKADPNLTSDRRRVVGLEAQLALPIESRFIGGFDPKPDLHVERAVPRGLAPGGGREASPT